MHSDNSFTPVDIRAKLSTLWIFVFAAMEIVGLLSIIWSAWKWSARAQAEATPRLAGSS